MPSLTLNIPHRSPLETRLLDALRARYQMSKTGMSRLHEQWRKAENSFLAYLPEREADAARRTKRELQGLPQYTTIVLPYSYAMLMTAHTYWTTVFLSRSPVLQYTGRHGESEQQVQAVEALLDYQTTVGGHLPVYYVWLLDVGKYGVGVIGNYWTEETAYAARIDKIAAPAGPFGMAPGAKPQRIRTVERINGYVGNKLFNVRPYDFYPDTRLALHRFQEGEFCAVRSEVGWHTIRDMELDGYYINTKALPKIKGTATTERVDGSPAQQLPQADTTTQYSGSPGDDARINDSNVYGLIDMVVLLRPSEWGVGTDNMPQKWVFTTDDKHEVLLSARPLGYYHARFPYQLLELEPEAYALAARGIPEVMSGVQQTIDWLVNSHFYNVRATLNNQVVVDPSRIVMKDLLDPLPGGAVRMKPLGYGTDPALAVKQLQVTDVTRTHLSDVQFMHEFGQRVMGINDQIMGMLEPGGRKSATEIRTSATFGTNRLKTNSEYFSALGFAPHSMMLLQNSQQYYEAELKLRIVGDTAAGVEQQFINVTPEAIQGFYDFVPVDGTLPVDRFAQANLWRSMFADLSKMPQIMAQFDMGRIFMHVAQLGGLKGIRQFRIQVAQPGQTPEQAAGSSVIPLRGGDMSRMPEPGQIAGMGATG